MEFSEEQNTDKLEELFREGSLKMYKMAFESLGSIIQEFQTQKSDRTEIIATFKALFLRRREITFEQDHCLAREGIYYSMARQSKGKEEAARFRAWAQKLRLVKSYSFNTWSTNQYFDPKVEPCKYLEKNVVEAEVLMKKSIKQYSRLMLSLLEQKRILLRAMPIEHLGGCVQGIGNNINCPNKNSKAFQVMLVYKRVNLLLLSEEELQKSKAFLEGAYQQSVEQNSDKEDAKKWANFFGHLQSLDPAEFKDDLYIQGEVLEQFKEEEKVRRVKRAEKIIVQCPFIFQVPKQHADQIPESSYVKEVKKRAKAYFSDRKHFKVISCEVNPLVDCKSKKFWERSVKVNVEVEPNHEQMKIEEQYQLFLERRLALRKMPIAHLEWLFQGMEMYKSDCHLAIDIFKMVYARKRQVVLQEVYQLYLRNLLGGVFDHQKNNEEAYKFFHLFEEMRELKKEDFQDGDYILDRPYSSAEEEEQMKRNVKEAIFEAEQIMGKDLREFTVLHLYLLNEGRLFVPKMPIKEMNRFISGLKFFFMSQEILTIEAFEVNLAFKMEVLKLSSAEESNENKEYLKKMYQLKVEQNQDSDLALIWKRQFEGLQSYRKEYFHDSYYINGLISQRLLAHKILGWENYKSDQTLGVYKATITAFVDRDYQCLLKEESYVQSAKEKIETSLGKLYVLRQSIWPPTVDLESGRVSRTIELQACSKKDKHQFEYQELDSKSTSTVDSQSIFQSEHQFWNKKISFLDKNSAFQKNKEMLGGEFTKMQRD